jgi:hypothetical protein
MGYSWNRIRCGSVENGGQKKIQTDGSSKCTGIDTWSQAGSQAAKRVLKKRKKNGYQGKVRTRSCKGSQERRAATSCTIRKGKNKLTEKMERVRRGSSGM